MPIARPPIQDELKGVEPLHPLIRIGSVCSLADKMDKLGSLMRTQQDYQDGNIIPFIKTWLRLLTALRLYGQTETADREVTVKEEFAELVNNRWCNPGHVTEKERLCTPDVELLAVSFFPCCLLREFTCVTC